MSSKSFLFEDLSTHEGQVIVLEAPRGSLRASFSSNWLDAQRGQEDLTIWHLDGDFQEYGVWAGVKDLFETLVPRIRSSCPQLTEDHNYELAIVSPALRRSISIQSLNLTDLSSPEERVRLYPAERALRIVHGLVDLVRKWKERADPSVWLIACENLDRAGFLVKAFFAELLRRCGKTSRLILFATGEAGIVETMESQFSFTRYSVTSLPLHHDKASLAGDEPGAAKRAREIEALVAGDEMATEEQLHTLFNLWRQAGNYERSLQWQFTAFAIYTYRGFYQDALRLGDAAFSNLRRHSSENEDLRFRIVNKLVSCYCAIEEPEKALTLLKEHGFGRVTNPVSLSYLYYLAAMLHVRFLPNKDLDLGAQFLDMSLRELYKSDLPAGDLQFQIAFNRNGLALIRHRQKRYTEAIDLCQASYDRLARHLSADRHKLHRSVLLYNIAQVYSAIGEQREAIRYYNKALAIDENYSEYYNERGNAFFNLREFERALADYRKAISLSPPYPEVLTNIGQCHRASGQWLKAIEAYGLALELNPRLLWVYAMRADCYEALERFEESIADYTAALEIDLNQPQLLANRACILYQAGRISESLADLDMAIDLSGGDPGMFRNRAVALTDLGRPDEAARDLEEYLSLLPDAEDRDEVLARLVELRQPISY